MTNGGDALMAGLRKAKDYVDLYDCKIIFGTRVVNAHKLILMMHSDYFKAAFNPNTFREGKSGEIELKDDDPEMVVRMMSFFYDLTYSCDNVADNANADNANASADSTAATSHEDIITHASMFALAVKYQVPELCHFAKCSFRHGVQTAWESEAFAEAIDIVFTSTPDDVFDLRKITLEIIHNHFSAVMNKAEIKNVLLKHPLLSYELLKLETVSSRHSAGTIGAHECAVCHQTKLDPEFAPGLPKMCVQCNSGHDGRIQADPGCIIWYH